MVSLCQQNLSCPSCDLLGTALGGDRGVGLVKSSAPGCSTDELGIRSQSTSGETIPNFTRVVTTGQSFVSGQDSVTSVSERRTARLKLHAVEDELENERVTMLGNLGLGVVVVVKASFVVFAREWWPQVLREAVLLDKVDADGVEHLGPHFADGMDTPVASLVQGGVRVQVRRLVGLSASKTVRHGPSGA